MSEERIRTVEEIIDAIGQHPDVENGSIVLAVDEQAKAMLRGLVAAKDLGAGKHLKNLARGPLPFTELYKVVGDPFNSGERLLHLQEALTKGDIPGVLRWAFWYGFATGQTQDFVSSLASGVSLAASQELGRRFAQVDKRKRALEARATHAAAMVAEKCKMGATRGEAIKETARDLKKDEHTIRAWLKLAAEMKAAVAMVAEKIKTGLTEEEAISETVRDLKVDERTIRRWLEPATGHG